MWKTTSVIIGIVLLLITLGIVMLASTSGIQGQNQFGNPNYFIHRQLLWLSIAAIGALITARIDYHVWRTMAVPLVVVSAVLLVMTLLPHIGQTVKGSSRWLRFGPVTFQPSELAKFTSIVMLSWWMARVQRRAEEFRRGLVIPLGCLGVILLLIFVEPDFGTTMLIAVVGFSLMFAGGSRFSYLLISALLGLLFFTLAIMQDAERTRRIVAFLNPEKYAQDEAFQLLNAIYAFVIGGGMGTGLGQGLQKKFYLPEAHTDFIFAILGEELGLPASMFVVLLFVAFLICGTRISVRAPDKFGRLLAFGITLMIALQGLINIAVVTGCMPTKGLPLPFISFGGSSLLVSLSMVGVLINVARQSGGDLEASGHYIKDSAHQL
ncbi:MAG TPA: putative lipid II flippase FtsW [Verrucomicrobia bacterium]|nr:MAG: cell division protein FtsW [Lentisphaerae bacterium GWF2_57_35]HBA83526.1 putative lipid II flippase FtsW [Verrucomicrobiota bacterium]